MEKVWADPKAWIALVSVCIGLCGFVFGVVSNYWSRRETRLDALSKILQPMVQGAQRLSDANSCRRRCELLKRSFPDAQSTQEATKRAHDLVQEYGSIIQTAREHLQAAESELSSRSFRFPDAIAIAVDKALKSLFEYARHVNDGLFEKADLQFAKFRDD